MSVLGTLFAVLGFLISPFGLFAVLLGFMGFFVLPVISKTTSNKTPSRMFLWLAKQPISRAAVVVSEHNDILFKSMSFSGLGVEMITIDGEEKAFEDPDSALHYWLGIPFAMADEKHGVLFDPRHAALGRRKHDSDELDESNYNATTEEWEQHDVSEWHKGVFEFPRAHELVNLSYVRELVDGGERSEYAKRVEELYKHSREPFGDGTPITKFFYPIVGFAITFFGIWFMSSQFGGGSIPGGSSVGYGAGFIAFALLSPTQVDWKRLGKVLGMIALPVVPLALLVVFMGPLVALSVVIAISLGFLAIPVLSFISKPISRLSGAFSKLFFKLAFLGYEQPVFEWTPQSYRLVEYDTLEEMQDVTWYGMFGSKVGFTFIPDESSWGAETMDHDKLESRQVVTDGGDKEETNLPNKFVKTNTMQRDSYGGFVPKQIKKRMYYLHTGIATARFNYSAVGDKSLKRLLQAKEEFGDQNNGMSDSMVFKTTAIAGLFGTILAVLLFVL